MLNLFRPTLTLFSRLCLLVFTYGFSLSSALGQTCTTASTCGQWSTPAGWPFKAVHATLLRNGKVLLWPQVATSAINCQPYLWDTTNAPTMVPQAGENIFCSGHALLADGKLLVAGGHNASSYKGLDVINIYNPVAAEGSNPWLTGLPRMNEGRWYPTVTALPSGEALVISGQNSSTKPDDPDSYNKVPQVWQPSADGTSGTWRNLALQYLPYYPYMFVAPNGEVFMAGPWRGTRYLNTSTNKWRSGPLSHLSTRNWGSAVTYDKGKVLLIGGTTCGWYDASPPCSNVPANTTEWIDLTAATPTWNSTVANNLVTGGRKLHTATLLPDGKVLVTGGSRGTEKVTLDSTAPALESEIWDPTTKQWSEAAALTIFRAYHSIALLLPNGKVLSAGGDKARVVSDQSSTAGSKSKWFEIYSPPYLFKGGARPTITSVSSNSVGYNAPLTVTTPDGPSIQKVTMLSLGSVTHGFNMGQRIAFLTPSVVPNTTNLSITTPLKPEWAPPGYYMLFILNTSGVPSVAKIIQLHR